MKIRAHAKINLNLHVVGKRDDGFHAIETLMVPLALHDTVEVAPHPQGKIAVTCDVPWVPCDDTNLTHRAAVLFFQETGLAHGAQIRLTKRIPAGAGLGGGSSNAAAVLNALNRLFNTGLPVDRLESLAAQIGSDVAWFIRSQPAICRGRGEILEPIALDHAPTILLLKPPFGVPTPWAYRAWGERSPRSAPECQDLGWVKIYNDLEVPVFRKFVLLPTIKNWLRSQPGVAAAGMSGSGSTLFAIVNPDAGSLADEARNHFGASLWTCQSLVLPQDKQPVRCEAVG